MLAALLTNLGGDSVRRKAQKHKRAWFDPHLQALIQAQGDKKVQARKDYLAQMHALTERLKQIGRQVPVLHEALDQVLLPYRTEKVVPLRHGVHEVIGGLDYQAMVDNDEFLPELDALLEWAEEEEIVLILIASERL